MTKRDLINDPNSCLNKAADDEPVFLLRANDPVAAEAVVYWVWLSNDRNLHQSKLAEAAEIAEAMSEWQAFLQATKENRIG